MTRQQWQWFIDRNAYDWASRPLWYRMYSWVYWKCMNLWHGKYRAALMAYGRLRREYHP